MTSNLLRASDGSSIIGTMTTSTAQRADVHRPSALITEDYSFLGCLDWGGSDSEIGAAKSRVALINRVIVDAGRQWARVHPSAQCDHCGAHIRYAALMLHVPTNVVLEVGETCLENRFERATVEFQAMRKQAQLDREQFRIKGLRAQFVAANPDLAWLDSLDFPDSLVNNGFVNDVARKLRLYGTLSPAQANAVRNAAARAAQWAAEKSQEVAQPVSDVVEGRIVITGDVVSLKYQDSRFGSTLKMLVRDDRGFKVWGSVPSKITVERGNRVRFEAEVVKSNSDPAFGFFSRPTKAVVL